MSGRRWVADDVLRALGSDLLPRAELAKRLPLLELTQISTGLYTLRDNGMAVTDGLKWALTEEGRLAAEADTQIRPGAAGVPRACRTPQKRTFRQRAWAELRRRSGKATIPDLLRVLDSDNPRNLNNLVVYFLALESAGILTRLKRRHAGTSITSPGHVVWLLGDDPGSKAPIWQATKRQVFDPNSKKIYPIQTGEKP